MTLEYISNSPKDTQALASKLAQIAIPGMTILLNGDLGAGKTTFTQSFAKSLGVTERIKSPTFNILSIYNSGKMPVYHFDAYRLEFSGGADQGFEDYIGTDGVSLIEWSDYILDIIPNDKIVMNFKRLEDEQHRIITIDFVGKYQELEEQIKL